MAGRLGGRVALITGAGMGIGRETALLFAEEGAGVVVGDIDANAAKETVALVEARGGRALATVGDVAIEADVRRMVADGARHFGRLDVLDNNAGVLWKDRDRSVLETDEKWWDRVIAINLKSAFWVTKYGIPELRRAVGGSLPRERRLLVHDRRRAGRRRRVHGRVGNPRNGMDEASGASRSFLTPPSAVPASRPSLQRSPLQQTWLQLTAAVAVAILLLLLAFVVWPVLRVLATSLAGPEGLTLAHYAEFFSSWRLVRILVQSLLVAVVSTVITVAVALVLAYAVTRTDIPGKRFVSLMSLLPLISPPFLVSLAFILLLGRNGVITRALHLDWSIYGFTGIVVSQVFTFLPQAYLLLANVLGNIDVSLEEAAENLGAGPLTTLRRVTLSLARPGLASAALIVFILCMTDFGNPILIGGRYNVLATEIYAQVIGMSNFAAGATMSVVLIVPCLVAYLVNASWVGTRSYVTVSAGARAAARPMPPALRWPLFVLSGGVGLFIAVIYALIPLGSVAPPDRDALDPRDERRVLEVSRRRPRRYQRAQADRPRDRGGGDQPGRRDRPDVRARRAAAPDGHRVLDLRIFLHQRDGHRQCGDFPHLSGVQPQVRGHPQPGRERIPGSGVRAGHDHSRDRHRLGPAPPRPGRGGPRRRPEALGKGDVHAPIASAGAGPRAVRARDPLARGGGRGQARHLHRVRGERAQDFLGAVHEGPPRPRREGRVHPRLHGPHPGPRRGREGEPAGGRDLGSLQR